MNKLIAAQIDTYMGSSGFIGFKEHQITGDKVAFGNSRSNLILIGGHSRQCDAMLCKNILNKARTIKA